MKLEIVINKETNFYYWVQVISGWDSHPLDSKTYNYYLKLTDSFSEIQKHTLARIKELLQSALEPRWVLAELYEANLKSPESIKFAELADALRDHFEAIWFDTLPGLESWQSVLRTFDFSIFDERITEISRFLDSDFTPKDVRKLYLLSNPLATWSVGHYINNTDFILVRPPGQTSALEISNTIATILHEYIHAIEAKSRLNRELFKNSYNEHIAKNKLPPLDGYSWKMAYVEALVYCFASKLIGGYLRPEIYQKARPTLQEMESGFMKLIKQQRYGVIDLINWVSLNILRDVENYIDQNRKIDQLLVDKIGENYRNVLLTILNK